MISDWQAIDQICPATTRATSGTSINAGLDMIMVADNYQDFERDLTDAGRRPAGCRSRGSTTRSGGS